MVEPGLPLRLGVLLTVSLARYESAVYGERAVAWVLVALIATLVAAGTYGLLAAHRSESHPGVKKTA